jgi:hypothetical protein
LDLDHDRIAHAALELEAAYAAALGELPGENREDLAIRVDELEELQDGVAAQAVAALEATAPPPTRAGTEETTGTAEPAGEAETAGTADTAGKAETAGEAETAGTPPAAAAADEAALDPDVLRYALERLEAALRARTAAGFRLR